MSFLKRSFSQLLLGGVLVLFTIISAIVVALQGRTLDFINGQKMTLFEISYTRMDLRSMKALLLVVPEGASHSLFHINFGITTSVFSIILSLLICSYMIYDHRRSKTLRTLRERVASRASQNTTHVFISLFLLVNSFVCLAAYIAEFKNHSWSSHFDVAQWLESIHSTNGTYGFILNNGQSFDLETWVCALGSFKGSNPNHDRFVETCRMVGKARSIMIPYFITSILATVIAFWASAQIPLAGRTSPKVSIHKTGDNYELDRDREDIELMGDFRDEIPDEPSPRVRGHQSYGEGIENDITYHPRRSGEDHDDSSEEETCEEDFSDQESQGRIYI